MSTARANKVSLQCLGTITVVLAAAFVTPAARASTATWTNTANTAVGLWTAAANWNAATYPGQDGANQGASLANSVAGSTYQAILNAPLPYTLGTLEIKNLGAGGTAWVIVTNAAFVVTNVLVRTAGRLQIDNQGVVTNAVVTVDQTNGQIWVNNGGSLFTSTNLTIGSSSGRSNVLTLGDNSTLVIGGSAGNSLTVGNGAGASYNRFAVTGSNAQIRTYYAPSIGGTWNEALFTGTGTLWDCNNTRFNVGYAGVSNTMTVSQGSLWLTNTAGQGLWVGYTTGNCYNRLVVTNGGHLFTQSGVVEGYFGTGNVFTVTGAGSLWDGGGNATAKPGDSGGTNNVLLVDQGGTVSNAAVNVGGGVGANGNKLIITNGGRWFSSTTAGTTAVGYYGTNNTAVVTGSNSLWDLGTRPLYLGLGTASTGAFARLQIDGGGIVTNGPVYVGYNAFTIGNTLMITNGGQLFTSTATSPFVGNGSASNTLIVSGSNSLWLHLGSGATYLGYSGGVGNTMRVENGGIFTNSANQQFRIGNNAATTNNLLVITSGGQFYYNHEFTVGYTGGGGNSVIITNGGRLMTTGSGSQATTIDSSGAGNTLLVDGANSLWVAGAQPVTVGNTASSNLLVVSNGGMVTNAGMTAIGSSGATDGLVVTNGSQIWLGTGGDFTVGSKGTNCWAWIGGNESVVASAPTNRASYCGANASLGNVLVVDNGGRLDGFKDICVGTGAGAVGNVMIVTNGGRALSSDTVRIAQNGNGTSNNVLLVVNGGLLEGTRFWMSQGATGPSSGNAISNAAGIYQFFSATPTFSNVVMTINSGTIAFRSITNADVKANWSGPLTNITFSGANAFRLNNATNLSSSSQTYVFDTGPSTNYVRLELVNGATRYRGQPGNTLTIGGNGQMSCSNTAAAVDLVFTNNGTLTLVNSTLTFTTNATLNGLLAIDMNTLATTNNTLIAGNLTLGASSILQVTGTGTNATLIRYTGTRSGKFGTENTPPNYRITYGPLSNGQIILQPTGSRGTALMIM